MTLSELKDTLKSKSEWHWGSSLESPNKTIRIVGENIYLLLSKYSERYSECRGKEVLLSNMFTNMDEIDFELDETNHIIIINKLMALKYDI